MSVAQLVNKLPTLMSSKVHYCVHKRPLLQCRQCRCSFVIDLNIIFPSPSGIITFFISSFSEGRKMLLTILLLLVSEPNLTVRPRAEDRLWVQVGRPAYLPTTSARLKRSVYTELFNLFKPKLAYTNLHTSRNCEFMCLFSCKSRNDVSICTELDMFTSWGQENQTSVLKKCHEFQFPLRARMATRPKLFASKTEIWQKKTQ